MGIFRAKKLSMIFKIICIILVRVLLITNFALAVDIEKFVSKQAVCLSPRSVVSNIEFIESFSEEIKKYGKEYDRRAKNLLDEQEFAKYKLVERLWVDENPEILRNKAVQVINILKQAPMLREVYGIGYPFYGKIDLRKRIYMTLDKLMSGEIDKEEFLKKITPDLDVLIVIRQQDEGPWSITENMDSKLKDYFIQYVSIFRKQWDKVDRDLQQTGIMTSIYSDREEALDILFHQRRYSLDFVYIPEHVWNNIPVFVDNADIKYFKFIRDILFSLESNFGNTSEVPLEFLHNYVLNVLSKTGAVNRKYLFDKLLDEHPYSELIVIYEQSRTIVVNKFEKALRLARKRKMVNYLADKIVLTKKGSRYLEKVLEYRADLLKKGYDLDGASFITEIRTIEEKLERALLRTEITKTKKILKVNSNINILVEQAI